MDKPINDPVSIEGIELIDCKVIPTRQSVKIILETDEINVPEKVWLALQKLSVPGDHKRLTVMLMPEDAMKDVKEHAKKKEPKPPASPEHRKRMAGLHKKGGLFHNAKLWEWLREKGYPTAGADDAKEDFKEYVGVSSLADLSEEKFNDALERFNKWVNKK